MALDSLVNVRNKHTMEAVNYIKKIIGHTADEGRLRLLMRVRGAVIHGAAPDVYESENYAQYYVDYGTDPIRDLELIVAKCLREAIFDGQLKYHPDSNKTHIDKNGKFQDKFRMSMPDTIIPLDA
ncbi:hypothetical protein [Methylorubrum extorquens]|uniref:hypothetical protein n=1 Tax=Methylorubrum extorquens TaxID=408 RepID=UPI000AE34843|nr:hypothetical protein [Methylorubrum extorquens]WIU38597.1 hypothetical protein KQ926_18620 [Methylorubrum extorquens]